MDEEMAFRVIWSKQALRDLENLTTYIAKDNPRTAEYFGNTLIEKVRNLSSLPLIGSIVPEINNPDYRQIIYSPFRIIYRIRNDKKMITILRIWHSARGEPEIIN